MIIAISTQRRSLLSVHSPVHHCYQYAVRTGCSLLSVRSAARGVHCYQYAAPAIIAISTQRRQPRGRRDRLLRHGDDPKCLRVPAGYPRRHRRCRLRERQRRVRPVGRRPVEQRAASNTRSSVPFKVRSATTEVAADPSPALGELGVAISAVATSAPRYRAGRSNRYSHSD